MSFVADMFSQKPEKVPTPDDPAVEEARRRRRLAAAASRGRQSTIFTGPGGTNDPRLLGRAALTGPGGAGG